MQKKVIIALFIIVGASLGVALLPALWYVVNLSENNILSNSITNGIIGAIIFFLFSLLLTNNILKVLHKVDAEINKISLQTLLFGSIGFASGLVVGAVISVPLFLLNVPFLNSAIPIVVMTILAALGFRISTTRMSDLAKLFAKKKTIVEVEQPEHATLKDEDSMVLKRRAGENYRQYKILDTSVIIDGRVYDIAKTGFLEGTILVPKFVLYELQYIADSADSLKRVRGRRGLDILNALQKEENIKVETYDGDFDDIEEVDTKLLKLARMLDGVVVTNDYNLNKVAEFQHVPVLNINALANAVKPVVIPGEKMHVRVVKEGTERQQGVAYLDDGTMVVVEDGQHFMNQDLTVVVTSALQTAAGRMIFAKLDHSGRGIEKK